MTSEIATEGQVNQSYGNATTIAVWVTLLLFTYVGSFCFLMYVFIHTKSGLDNNAAIIFTIFYYPLNFVIWNVPAAEELFRWLVV